MGIPYTENVKVLRYSGHVHSAKPGIEGKENAIA